MILSVGAYLIFSHGGNVLQNKLFGSYIPAEATVEEIIISYDEHNNLRAPSSIYKTIVYLYANYEIDNQNYTGKYPLENFVAFNLFEEKKARAFAADYADQAGAKITIYHDPKNPEESVLHPEDEEHTFLRYLIMFSSMILALGFIIAGVSGLGVVGNTCTWCKFPKGDWYLHD